MGQNKIKQELRETVAEVFEVPLSKITDDLKSGDIEPWDSLGHLQLCMAIEEKFSIKFDTQDILNMSSLGEFQEYIEKHSKSKQ